MVSQGLVPNDLRVILAEVVGQIADRVVELVGLRLEIGGDLGHVLDRLDLDLRVLLVPGTDLGALEPIAQRLYLALLILPAFEIFVREWSEPHQPGSPGERVTK